MSEMWHEVLSWAVVGVGVIAAALVTAALNYLWVWLKLMLTVEQERRLREVVHRGIAFAEEEVARKLKLGQIAPSRDHQNAGKKLAAAVEYVTAVFPTMAEKTIVREIHAELAKTPDVGATGGKALP